MLDILDVKDAWMGAKTNFDRWEKDFMMNFQELPMMKAMAAKAISETPPEVLSKLKEMDGKKFGKLMEGLKMPGGKK